MNEDQWYYQKLIKIYESIIYPVKKWEGVKNDPGLYKGTIYQENTKITMTVPEHILVITDTIEMRDKYIKDILNLFCKQMVTSIRLLSDRIINSLFDIRFLVINKWFDWYGLRFDKVVDLSTINKSKELEDNIKYCFINNPNTILMQGDKYEELLDELANALDEEEVNAIFPWYDDEEDDDMTGCGWCIRDCDGKDSSGKCPEVCDSESCDSEGCGENKKCCQEKKCECGAASCGSSAHSSYCPLYEP